MMLVCSNISVTGEVPGKATAREEIPMRTIILMILLLLIIAALPTWPYSAAWGYYPSGGIGLILVILLLLALLGHI